jgi:putative heme-binding domain-containing protein
MAATAKRLPADVALPIVESLLRANGHTAADAADPHIPLLLWWAVEQHAITSREQVLSCFATKTAWQAPFVVSAVQSRLIRRYVAEGASIGDTACVRLLDSAPPAMWSVALSAIELGLQERTGRTAVSGNFLETRLAAWQQQQRADVTDHTLTRVLAQLGNSAAQQQLVRLALDPRQPTTERVKLLSLAPVSVDELLQLVAEDGPEAVRLASLDALQARVSETMSARLLDVYPRLPARLQARTRDLLLSRKSGALSLLQAVAAGRVPATDVALDQLRAVALHRDPALDALVRKLWGNVQTGTPEEKLAEVRRFNNDLRAAAGHTNRGQALFAKHCATCHRLHGQGQTIGPDLTLANRKDRDYLLLSIVDPSAVVRKEFLSYHVETTDGRVLTGLIVEQSVAQVTLLGANGQKVTLPRHQIAELSESPVSLMPENLLKLLTPDELRDLFAYLQAETPPSGSDTRK